MNFLQATAPAGVAVTVSARLHLGFLDLNGEFGRQFGSLGLSISETARTPHIASRQRGSGPLAGLGVRVSRSNAKRRRCTRSRRTPMIPPNCGNGRSCSM